MASLPNLVCNPIGRPSHLTKPVCHPRVDLAPAIARHFVRGKELDLSEAQKGKLPLDLVLDIVDDPQLRALAWQGRLSFEGLRTGIDGLVAEIGDHHKAKRFLACHAQLLRLWDRQSKFNAVLEKVRRAKTFGQDRRQALFFPDTDETVTAQEVERYLDERWRELQYIPFAFPVAIHTWRGVDEGSLRAELQAKGSGGFDLERQISSSLSVFEDDVRDNVVDETLLWKSVGKWIESAADDVEAQSVFACELAEWNSRQHIQSYRIVYDAVVGFEAGVDRKKVVEWCRGKLAELAGEIRALTTSWSSSRQGAKAGS